MRLIEALSASELRAVLIRRLSLASDKGLTLRNGAAVGVDVDTLTAIAEAMDETGPVEQRSYGDEALARVDVTTARLALGDLDGAREALRPVLDLPPERRSEQLAAGLILQSYFHVE